MAQQAEKYLYLIKYTAEIGTKKRNTRLRFIEKLSDNIKAALDTEFNASEKTGFKVSPDWNHIQVETPEAADDLLARIAGIKYFTPAIKVPANDINEVIEQAYQYFKDRVSEKATFAVRCRKSQRDDVSTREFQTELGTRLNALAEVDLDNPDTVCYIEIRKQEAFFFSERKKGMHGIPLGIEGKTLTMLGGGIDSPVAAYLIYKTGMDQDFVYFDLDGKDAVMQSAYPLVSHLRNRYGHGSNSKLIKLNFLPLINEIMKTEPSFRNLALKYCFYKAGERLCKIKYAEAMVTGEAIGQVSTQTLKNLSALDSMTTRLILRPLSAYSKEEIQDVARQIGTYDMAYKGKEYCALEAQYVETSASPGRLMKEVAKIDHDIIEQVINERTEINAAEAIAELKKSKYNNESANTAVDTDITEQIIIDLRTDEQAKQQPYPGAQVIPFDKAWNEFHNWDKNLEYYLVCEAGSKSQILANFMKEQGFDADHLQGGIRQMKKAQS